MTKTKGTVCISGMEGFIGGHCHRILSDYGYTVYPIPRTVLENPKDLYKALHSAKPDYSIHLAAYGNHNNQTDYLEIVNANVFKTMYLLTTSCDLNVKAFLNISTSSVYAKTSEPMSEKGRIDPKSMYAKSKYAAEILVKGYAEGRISVINVRPFSIYGPGEADHRMIPTMFNSLQLDKKDRKAKMILDLKPVHDWTYVDDFVQGLVTIMKNAKELDGRDVNIGTGKQYTNEQIKDKIEWITGKKLLFKETSGLRANDMRNWRADNELIRSLGWLPKVDIMSGLREVYKQYAKK